MFTKDETRALYRRRAPSYDRVTRLFPLIGARVPAYRRLAVQALALQGGDTVVELGCGTGANFRLLHRAVGEEGSIIACDLTDAMLREARSLVDAQGWGNVELVESDAAVFEVPAGVDAVLSTFAITLVPEYDEIIQQAAEALRCGGRLAVLDLKEPDWPGWLVGFGAWLNRPFGVSLDLADRHPWESVGRYLHEVEFKELYGGGLYLSVGERVCE